MIFLFKILLILLIINFVLLRFSCNKYYKLNKSFEQNRRFNKVRKLTYYKTESIKQDWNRIESEPQFENLKKSS